MSELCCLSIAFSSSSDKSKCRPINFQFLAACVSFSFSAQSFSFSAQSFSPHPCGNEVTSTCSGVLSRVVDLRRLVASAAGLDCCLVAGICNDAWSLVDVGSDCGGVTENKVLSTNGDRTGVSIDCDLVETGVLAADSDCIEDGVSTNESDLVEVGVLGIDTVVEYVMFVSPILLSLFSITFRISITLQYRQCHVYVNGFSMAFTLTPAHKKMHSVLCFRPL